MPKDTKTLGNNKARACESLGFAHKKGCANILTQPHIKVQPVIIHNRWYNKVYSCVKILYGISEVIVDDSSNIKYRSRFKRTDKLHKCKRFFGK